MIYNEIVIEKPVLSIKGVITVDLPEYQTRLILKNIKQVKGLGTHDADKLRGQPPSSDHIYTIQVMLSEDKPLTAEQTRNKAEALRAFETGQSIEVNKRPLSELLALGIVEIVPHIWPPQYKIDHERAKKVLTERMF